MSTWLLPSVDTQPSACLILWQAYRFSFGDQYWDILRGWDPENSCGRCSTPVVALTPAAATAKTQSGRLYRLEGEPGQDPDAQYVFESRYGMTIPPAFQLIEVTDEYWTLIQFNRAEASVERPLSTIARGSRGLRAVQRRAEKVFEDPEIASAWTASYSQRLGTVPLSLTGTKAGRRLIHAELTRIRICGRAE